MAWKHRNGKKLGRPSSYKPFYAEQAKTLCAVGLTDKELSEHFGVTRGTISVWKAKYPDFADALKPGKAAADDRVERSLFERATGYSYETEKVFMPSGAKKPVRTKITEHVPPDTTAMIFWLKNRRPDSWRDKREEVYSGKLEITEVRRVIVEPRAIEQPGEVIEQSPVEQVEDKSDESS